MSETPIEMTPDLIAKGSSMARVAHAAAEAVLKIRILKMAQSTRTAQEAADAAGCDVSQIVKSLIFVRTPTPGSSIFCWCQVLTTPIWIIFQSVMASRLPAATCAGCATRPDLQSVASRLSDIWCQSRSIWTGRCRTTRWSGLPSVQPTVSSVSNQQLWLPPFRPKSLMFARRIELQDLTRHSVIRLHSYRRHSIKYLQRGINRVPCLCPASIGDRLRTKLARIVKAGRSHCNQVRHCYECQVDR